MGKIGTAGGASAPELIHYDTYMSGSSGQTASHVMTSPSLPAGRYLCVMHCAAIFGEQAVTATITMGGQPVGTAVNSYRAAAKYYNAIVDVPAGTVFRLSGEAVSMPQGVKGAGVSQQMAIYRL